MHDRDVPEYIAHVDKRLNEENGRLMHYLDASTRKPLISCVEKQLLQEHVIQLLEKVGAARRRVRVLCNRTFISGR